MRKEYNSVAYIPEEAEQAKKLIDFLVNENINGNSKHYNEIHITTDGYCTIIEWDRVPYDHEFGVTFQPVDSDEIVAKEVHFPDNHYEYLPAEQEEEAIKYWLEDNPGWAKDEYGHWYNIEENEKAQKYWNEFFEKNKTEPLESVPMESLGATEHSNIDDME